MDENSKPLITSAADMRYFVYLLNLLRVEGKEYLDVLTHLYYKPFEVTLSLDNNRLDDGIDIRRYYIETHGFLPLYKKDTPDCSVLEMLVALSIRITEFISTSSSDIFFELLDNLSIRVPNNRYDQEMIDYYLDIFMMRTYAKNGYMGLFPLENPKKDQRKVEIWYQMMAYLDEKYPYID